MRCLQTIKGNHIEMKGRGANLTGELVLRSHVKSTRTGKKMVFTIS